MSEGGGVYLGSGRVLTAYHLILGSSRVNWSTGNGTVFSAATLAYSDPGNDLAIVSGDEPAAEVASTLPRFGLSAVGDKVLQHRVQGWPQAGPQGGTTVRRVLDKGKRGRTFLLSATPWRSVSGSPVWNDGGEVIGIACSGFTTTNQWFETSVSSLGEEALSFRPERETPLSVEAARVLGDVSPELVRALGLQRSGHYDRADELLETLGAREREVALYWELRAFSLHIKADSQGARDCAERASAMGGRSWWSQCVRGLEYERLGESDKARVALERAIQLRDKYPELTHGYWFGPWAALAVIYKDLGWKEKADEAMRKATQESLEAPD